MGPIHPDDIERQKSINRELEFLEGLKAWVGDRIDDLDEEYASISEKYWIPGEIEKWIRAMRNRDVLSLKSYPDMNERVHKWGQGELHDGQDDGVDGPAGEGAPDDDRTVSEEGR